MAAIVISATCSGFVAKGEIEFEKPIKVDRPSTLTGKNYPGLNYFTLFDGRVKFRRETIKMLTECFSKM